jgi:3-hydroxy-9,10-secoandrosta-1,3,5(10)-triene-9,17-dione monooxygenase reductase component
MQDSERALAGPSQSEFKSVLGRFPSGVTVVTGGDVTHPSGFTCQAFSSLSLVPPMVVVLPSKDSRSWRRISAESRFCVNLLARHQEGVSVKFAQPDSDKFVDVDWWPSPLGSPILGGVVGWIDCKLIEVYDGGDHFIALGAVHHCSSFETDPLVFHRGQYTGTVI